MSEQRLISVLCAARRSVYHDISGVRVYDKTVDARTFAGDTPVVCHPPCRSWSAFYRHQAKPEHGESELGLWCCEMLLQCGGVLEQPAHSLLFAAAGLPRPGGRFEGDIWSLEIWQSWFGYPTRKATWLCFCGISSEDVQLPFLLHNRGRDKRTMKLMSRRQRSETTHEFAQWMVDIARTSRRMNGYA